MKIIDQRTCPQRPPLPPDGLLTMETEMTKLNTNNNLLYFILIIFLIINKTIKIAAPFIDHRWSTGGLTSNA